MNKNEKKFLETLNEKVNQDMNFSEISNNINYEKYKKEEKMFKLPKKFILAVTSFVFVLILMFVIISLPNNSNVDLNKHVLMSASEKIEVNNKQLKEDLEYQEFVAKLQLFSAKLSVAVYNDNKKSENLCISPVSIYMALAMTISNADGIAKNELLEAVGVTEDEVNNFTKYLLPIRENDVS